MNEPAASRDVEDDVDVLVEVGVGGFASDQSSGLSLGALYDAMQVGRLFSTASLSI